MKLKLAKVNNDADIIVITQKEIEEEIIKKGNAVFYLERDNSLKDIQKLKTSLEKTSKSVHFNEIRYGLDKDSFLYELHIINNN